MAMRATGGRVTKQSPAALLYGRELRLPQQMIDPRVPRARHNKLEGCDSKACTKYNAQQGGRARTAQPTSASATAKAQQVAPRAADKGW
eukprot:scaffold3239_cov142-Isochrysis_galbana.AAC.2